MKYGLGKKICYSVIILALLLGLTWTAFFGIGNNGYGSTKDINLGLDLAGGVSITYEIQEDNPSSQDFEDTIYKLEKRIEGKSTESQVYREGDKRITVEIPGVTDANAILEELGTPGSLEFLDSTAYTAWGNGESYEPLLTGSDVKSAQAYTDTSSSNSSSAFGVSLTFTDEGAVKFEKATSANVGKIIYIVYDGKVVSAPNVKQTISGGSASITDISDYDEADTLATYIRIGSIPLTLKEVSSNIVGAQLGHDAIRSSLIAAGIGLALLCIFMIVLYRLPGVVATIALWMYTIVVLFLVSVYDLTLTLPGIAGIILGIGMAVDANVIIYTRIREELGAGRSVENAITAGYSKATSAIVDGNVTTLIAAAVLYIFGTGPVKGFATTLAVGIVVSMFTALIITRVVMKLFYNFGFKDAKWYGKTVHKKTLNVLGIRKWCFIGSAAVIVAGFIAMGVFQATGNRMLNFSLEFVGGTTTSFTFDKDYSTEEIENGIIPVIKSSTGVNQVQQQKVQDSTAVSFKTTDLTLDQREAMEEAVKAKYPIKDGTIVESDTISSSVSDTMKRDAFISVILSTICMLIYIFIRFRDIKFAAAAVIALLHDVLVVLAFYAFTRVSVGTTFIACMLTIVGYSINGTIIIFDRIRELLKTANSKTNITELVNSAITSTMTRTVNTSLTTLIMLVVLFILGVSSVKEFALPLMVGIVVGGYSSICLTSAMWYVMGGKKRGITDAAKKAQEEKKKKASADGAQV
ncbi:MAG: protein translocase subunit SecD [Lachnospira sp.]|nr:protein translocase subunit SecD [Lachnospira sp.]